MEAQIYKLKKFVKRAEIEALGFKQGESNKDEYTLEVIQPMNGELFQSTLNGIYGNQKWKEKFYKGHEEMFKEALGLEYDEKGKVKLTEHLVNILQTWNIQIDFKQKILSFTSSDPFDGKVYIQSAVLNTYCKEQINKMKELGYIEEKGFRIRNN